MPLKDLETEWEPGRDDDDSDEWETQCIHGKWDDEACPACDSDPELQGEGGDIIEDDVEDDEDGGELVGA